MTAQFTQIANLLEKVCFQTLTRTEFQGRKKNNWGIVATIAIYCFFVHFIFTSRVLFFFSSLIISIRTSKDDNHIRHKHSNQEVFFLNFTWNVFLDYKLTNSYTRVTWIVFCFDIIFNMRLASNQISLCPLHCVLLGPNYKFICFTMHNLCGGFVFNVDMDR